jgi:hypothetical protein
VPDGVPLQLKTHFPPNSKLSHSIKTPYSKLSPYFSYGFGHARSCMAGRLFRLIFRPRPFSLTEHVKPFSFLSFLDSLSLHFVVPFLVLHLQLSFCKLGLADLSAQPTLHDFLKIFEKTAPAVFELTYEKTSSQPRTTPSPRYLPTSFFTLHPWATCFALGSMHLISFFLSAFHSSHLHWLPLHKQLTSFTELRAPPVRQNTLQFAPPVARPSTVLHSSRTFGKAG